jgi:hypothetical protein
MLPEAPQLSNSKSQYSLAAQSSLLAHATPPPVLAPSLVSAGAPVDDVSLEPGVPLVVVVTVVVVSSTDVASSDEPPPHATTSNTAIRRAKRSMRRVDHHARSPASGRRMLLLMSSPWRTALLLALASLPASPGFAGCFAEQCTDEVDADLPGDEVKVTLRNDTNAPIFVPAGEGCSFVPFTMERSGDELKWSRAACEWSCEEILDSCACGADCVANTLLRIEPGGSYDITWDLALYAGKDLSLDCPVEGCPTHCYRRVVAGDGDYRVTASAGTACVGGATACSCSDGVESCQLAAELDGTATLTAQATLTLPGDSVELAFH